MDDKLMPSNDDTQNYPFWSYLLFVAKFGYWKFKTTDQELLKVPKVFEPTAIVKFGYLYNLQFNVPSFFESIKVYNSRKIGKFKFVIKVGNQEIT